MENQQKNEKLKEFKAINFAFELGFLIAVPIIIFGLIGRLIDNYFNIAPFGILISVIFSIIITSFLVYKKALKILS